MKAKRISIVTPCLNAERFIAETMESVLKQTAVTSGRVQLEYIIRDGGSKDRTLDIARAFPSSAVSLHSEPDSGMYDALARGLRAATGDWIAYLNAGDFFSPRAFDVVLDVIENHDVRWLTGFATEYNEVGQLVHFSLPFKYRRRFVRSGQYSRRAPLFLPWIQQESTFWHASLHETVDFAFLSGLRLAGDGYLWHRFASRSALTIVGAYLGGFRRHVGQLSENLATYREELRSFSEPASPLGAPLAFFDNLMWFAPRRLKKIFNPRELILFDRLTSTWR